MADVSILENWKRSLLTTCSNRKAMC